MLQLPCVTHTNIPHSPHITHLTDTSSSPLNSKCSHLLLSHVRAAALHRHVLAQHLHHPGIFLEAPGVFLVDFYEQHISKERKELRVQTLNFCCFSDWKSVIHTRQQKAHTAGALNQLWKNKSNFYWSSSIVYDIKPNRATDTTQWSHRTMAAAPSSYIHTLQAEVTGHMSVWNVLLSFSFHSFWNTFITDNWLLDWRMLSHWYINLKLTFMNFLRKHGF